MTAKEQVTQHADTILRARKALGLEEDKHPLELYLALMEVESGGRTDLEDRDSYIGPFQIGDAYLKDARDFGLSRKQFADAAEDLPTSREALRSDVYASALTVMLHFERYNDRHGYNPLRMAAMHKGGVGTAKQITRKINAGMSVERAIYWASTAFRYTSGARAGQLIVPRTYLYVYGTDPHTPGLKERRFVQCFADYEAWVEEHFGDTPEALVCAPDEVTPTCACCGQSLT